MEFDSLKFDSSSVPARRDRHSSFHVHHVTLVLIAQLLCSTLQAQTEPVLKMEVMPFVPRSRTDGPIEAVISLKSTYAKLLEGTLILTLRDGPSIVGTCQLERISLAGGQQLYRATLPTTSVGSFNDTLEVEGVFVQQDGRRIHLGETILPAVPRHIRGGVICISRTSSVSMQRRADLTKSMRLDPFAGEGATDRLISSFPAGVDPDDMPKHPLGYCAFDLVVLIDTGFTHLSDIQLDALRRWIDAGGSAYLAPPARMPEEHSRFVQLLRNEHAAESRDDGLELYHVGLGRLVIDTRERDALPADVAAFLWKLTVEQRKAVGQAGTWRQDLQRPARDPNSYQRYNQMGGQMGGDANMFNYAPRPMIGGSDLIEALRPRTARLIPFSVVLLMVGAYILVVGPVDYFILGAIRQRKLTWVVFPVVTAAFTVSGVAMSNHYLGRTDHRRALTIIDVGTGGAEIRRNRIELIFAGNERVERIDVRQAVLTSIDHERLNEGHYYQQNTTPPTPPIYAGRFPSSYQVMQRIRQWSPQVYRTLRIDSAKDASGLYWDRIDPARLGDAAYRQTIPSLLAGDREQSTLALALMHERSCIAILNANGQDEQKQQTRYYNNTRATDEMEIHTPPHISPQFRPMSWNNEHNTVFPGMFLGQISSRAQEGFFSIVSQVSPTGGGNFEDMTLLDPTDPGQWLLIAITHDGNEWIVYRRTYRAPR